MSKILLKGKTNNFWKLDIKSYQVKDPDYPYVKPIEAYGRFGIEFDKDSVSDELDSNLPWDCFQGFGVFGQGEAIQKAFETIKAYMESLIDEPDFEDDLMDEGTLSRLFFYSIPKTEFKVIIAAGYYSDPIEEMNTFVESIPGVYAITQNNSLSSGDTSPFEDILINSEKDKNFPQEYLPLATYIDSQSN